MLYLFSSCIMIHGFLMYFHVNAVLKLLNVHSRETLIYLLAKNEEDERQ